MRETGNFIKLLGVMGSIALISLIMGAALLH